jgi:hypothetical protein
MRAEFNELPVGASRDEVDLSCHEEERAGVADFTRYSGACSAAS